MKTKKNFMVLLALGAFGAFGVANAQSWTPGTGVLYTNPSTTKVGIGTSTPYTAVNISGYDWINSGLTVDRRSGWGSTIFMRNMYSNTDMTSSYAVTGNKMLGGICFQGTNNSTFGTTTGAVIRAMSVSDWTTTSAATKLEFYTTAQGVAAVSSTTPQMSLDGNGNLYLSQGGMDLKKIHISNDIASTGLDCWSDQPFKLRGKIGTTDYNFFYIGQNNTDPYPYTYIQGQKNSNGALTNIKINTLGGGTFIGRNGVFVGNNGDVCINCTDPKGYKLAVGGSVIAESITVKLQSNWPDYTFKRNIIYDL